MAKWTQRSYWKVVNGVRAQFDLTLAEARAAYRHLRDRLGRSVFGTDLTKHPRLTREEVRAARLELTAAEVRETERREERRALAAEADALAREIAEELEYEDYDEYEVTATTEGDTPRRK